MASLTGTQVKHTYDSLLKLEDNDGLNSGLKKVTDGLGTQSPLSLSEIEVVSSVNVEASGFQTPTGTSDQLLVANGTTTSASALSGANINGTTNYVAKFDSANSVADSLIYDDGTNVGIGTTSPDFKLDVAGDIGMDEKLYHNGDHNTYIAFGADTQTFRTGGSDRVTITNNGVGIGTTSPTTPLHVVGDATIQNANGTNPTDAGSLYFKESGNTWGTDYFGFRINQQGVSNYLNFQSANTTTVRDILTLARDTGNVGIGTTSPSAKLHIEGGDIYAINNAGDPRLVLGDSVSSGNWGYIQWKSINDRIDIGTSGTPALSIEENGNVGIGTTSPIYKLQVNGGALNTLANFQSTDAGAFISFSDDTTTSGEYAQIGAVGDAVNVRSGNATTATFSASGNVGIGTTSPQQLLDITNTSAAPVLRLSRNQNLGTTLWAGESLGDIEFYSNDPSLPAVYGKISVVGGPDSGTPSAGYPDGHMVFETMGQQGGNILAERMRITDTGNVGIGTSSPSEKLEVAGNVKIGDNAKIFSDGSITLDIDYNNNQTDRSFRITQHGTANELFRVQENGNVGIGTTSPAYKLEVVDTSNPAINIIGGAYDKPYLRFTNSSGTSYYSQIKMDGANNQGFIIDIDPNLNSAYDYFNIIKRGVSAFYINRDDYVGIGTTSPAYKLDIVQTAPNTTALALQNDLGNYNVKIGDNSRAGLISLFDSTGVIEKIKINGGGNSYFNGGNVGIGTTSPTAVLDVLSTDAQRDAKFRAPNGEERFYFYIGGTGNSSVLDMFQHDGTTIGIKLSSAANSYFNGGNVGIGTASPQEKLDISAGNIRLDDSQQITWATTDANIGRVRISGSEASDIITFFTDNSEKMRLTNTGLGIGTTSPAVSLDVNGSARALNLYIAGNIIHDADTDTIISFNTDEVGVSAGGIKQLTVTSDNVNITDTLSYNYPSATGQYNGEIVSFGTFYTTNGTIAAGDVIVYTQAGINTGWFKASATTTYGKGMFGIAMGTTAADGILVKGFASNAAYTPSTSGVPVYISTTAGTITSTAPSTTGDVVRLVGYMLDAANDEIYFSPDESWTIA